MFFFGFKNVGEQFVVDIVINVFVVCDCFFVIGVGLLFDFEICFKIFFYCFIDIDFGQVLDIGQVFQEENMFD